MCDDRRGCWPWTAMEGPGLAQVGLRRVMGERGGGQEGAPCVGGGTLLLLVCPRGQGSCLTYLCILRGIWRHGQPYPLAVGAQQVLIEFLLEAFEDQ